jgi:adenosine deaminase
MTLDRFISLIPKAELHLHIEGTFEPELMFRIAERNNVKIKYSSVDELKKAYDFGNLQDFLNIYYAGAGVLLKEEDFYDLTWQYLSKIHEQSVIHTEIFFDPQTHTSRGVPFPAVINGISRALEDGKNQYGITYKLIMCILRHLDEENALETINEAVNYKNLISAIGLDSSEVGHPPSKFERVFRKARQEGFLTVAHAGEEGPADYVWEALNLLEVSRIDHGNRSLEDEQLVKRLAENKIPLTVCPLSNFRLKVVDELEKHPLKTMLESGLLATINSDDPAYFGGYINENYRAAAEALSLTKEDIYLLAKNSFEASFLDEEEKKKCLKHVDDFYSADK